MLSLGEEEIYEASQALSQNRVLKLALPQLVRAQYTPVSYVLCILLKINSLRSLLIIYFRLKFKIFKLTIPRLLNSCHQMYSQTFYFHPQTQWC